MTKNGLTNDAALSIAESQEKMHYVSATALGFAVSPNKPIGGSAYMKGCGGRAWFVEARNMGQDGEETELKRTH